MSKCSECGFLAARVWRTTQFVEIDEEKRRNGKIGSAFGGCEPTPICFINSFDIKEEVEILRKEAHDEPAQDSYGQYISPHWEIYVKVVLNTERKCESFRRWQQGFTPKEHKEMVDREMMQKWQMEREEADKKWRTEQEEIHSKEEWRRYIFLAVMTIVSVIVGIILGHFI